MAFHFNLSERMAELAALSREERGQWIEMVDALWRNGPMKNLKGIPSALGALMTPVEGGGRSFAWLEIERRKAEVRSANARRNGSRSGGRPKVNRLSTATEPAQGGLAETRVGVGRKPAGFSEKTSQAVDKRLTPVVEPSETRAAVRRKPAGLGVGGQITENSTGKKLPKPSQTRASIGRKPAGFLDVGKLPEPSETRVGVGRKPAGFSDEVQKLPKPSQTRASIGRKPAGLLEQEKKGSVVEEKLPEPSKSLGAVSEKPTGFPEVQDIKESIHQGVLRKKERAKAKRAVAKVLMSESAVNTWELFEFAMAGVPLPDGCDLHGYFQAALLWSTSKGERRADWVATVMMWIQRDHEAGKMKRVKTTTIEDQWEYLQMGRG